MTRAEPALRVRCSRQALADNWRWFRQRAGVPAAAAVKADAYGTGIAGAVSTLRDAGCDIFLVSTWAEAEVAAQVAGGHTLLVLHGFHPADAPMAAALPQARPVLNTMAQVRDWAAAFPGRAADLMADTGMNRLGLAESDVVAALDLLPVEVLHSHLACADTPAHPLNAAQHRRFAALAAATPGVRHSLANSAGVCLGADWAFDLVRPGLGLFGGHPHPDAPAHRVAVPEARVIQMRTVPAGAPVGYGAVWIAPRDSRIAILNIGYADGVPRAVSPHLAVEIGGRRCMAAGRISMDMTAFDVSGADVAEGDWLPLDWDLAALSAGSGVTEYELLTGLSRRAPRLWH